MLDKKSEQKEKATITAAFTYPQDFQPKTNCHRLFCFFHALMQSATEAFTCKRAAITSLIHALIQSATSVDFFVVCSSIHALMQSTTALNRSVTPTNIFFNPRTRAECDQSQNKGLANPHFFNPRTHTECDVRGKVFIDKFISSIHALIQSATATFRVQIPSNHKI